MTNPNHITVSVETIPSTWISPETDQYTPIFDPPYQRVIGMSSQIGEYRKWPLMDPSRFNETSFNVSRVFAERWTEFFVQTQLPFDSAEQDEEIISRSAFDCMIFARHMLGDDISNLTVPEHGMHNAYWRMLNPTPKYRRTVPMAGQLALGCVGYLFSDFGDRKFFEHAFVDLGSRSNLTLQIMEYGGYMGIVSYAGLMQAFYNSEAGRQGQAKFAFRQAPSFGPFATKRRMTRVFPGVRKPR